MIGHFNLLKMFLFKWVMKVRKQGVYMPICTNTTLHKYNKSVAKELLKNTKLNT